MTRQDLIEARERADALQPPARYGGWLLVGALQDNYGRGSEWVPEALRGHKEKVQMEAFFYVAVRN